MAPSGTILRSLIDFFTFKSRRARLVSSSIVSSSIVSSSTVSRPSKETQGSDSDTSDVEVIEADPTKQIKTVVQKFLEDMAYPYTISSTPTALDSSLVEGLIAHIRPWIEQSGEDIAKWTVVCHYSVSVGDVRVARPFYLSAKTKQEVLQMAYNKLSYDVKALISLYTWSVS